MATAARPHIVHMIATVAAIFRGSSTFAIARDAGVGISLCGAIKSAAVIFIVVEYAWIFLSPSIRVELGFGHRGWLRGMFKDFLPATICFLLMVLLYVLSMFEGVRSGYLTSLGSLLSAGMGTCWLLGLHFIGHLRKHPFRLQLLGGFGIYILSSLLLASLIHLVLG